MGAPSPKGAAPKGHLLAILQTCCDKALSDAWQGHAIGQCRGLISADNLQQFLPYEDFKVFPGW